MKLNILVIVCLIACAGCSHKVVAQGETSPKDFVALALGDATQNAHTELAMLAELRGKGLEPLLPPSDPTLSKPLSIDWTGAASKALKDVCLGIGYRYRELGKSTQDLLVVVNGLNRPAHEILEDIAWQVQPQATVKVDPITRTVTLAKAGK